MSWPSLLISVRRDSPKVFFSLRVSFLTSVKILAGLASSSSMPRMLSWSSRYSVSSRSRSSVAMRRSCMSRMARACTSSRPNSFISPLRAASASAELRINWITRSRLPMAMRSPASMWALSLARLRSYSVRRTTTCSRKAMKFCSAALSVIVSGVPPTSASMLAEKVLCIAVSLYRLFSTTMGCTPPRSSMTTRIPTRLDSSRISDMPSMRLSLAS